MKKMVLSVFFFMSIFFNSFAHSDPDRIVGTYLATYEGEESKVSIFKEDDGTYTARVIWVKEKYDKDGNLKLLRAGRTSEGARLDHGNRYVGALAETGMKSGCPSDMKNL